MLASLLILFEHGTSIECNQFAPVGCSIGFHSSNTGPFDGRQLHPTNNTMLGLFITSDVILISFFCSSAPFYAANCTTNHLRKIAAKQMINYTHGALFVFVRCSNNKSVEIGFFAIIIHWLRSFLQYLKHCVMSKVDDRKIKICQV